MVEAKTCPVKLVSLRKYLKDQVNDEQDAYLSYRDASKVFAALKGSRQDIGGLSSMSKDELRHKGKLKEIIRHIDERCGR